MSPSPSPSLAEALSLGDLASAIRLLDRAVEVEEKKRAENKEGGDATTTTIKCNGVNASSLSSSSSSSRLINALTSRALCHERLGMFRKALKVRSRVF